MYKESANGLKVHKKIKIPDESRFFIFSDVHGKKNEVDLLIKKAGGKDTDHYGFIGDVIDRGHHSSALLFDIIFKDNYHMCIGNHEHFLINSCNDQDYFDTWIYKDDKVNNGGEKTFNSLNYVGMNFFKDKLIDKCPLILEIEHKNLKLGLVHAEIPLLFNKKRSINHWNDIINYAYKDDHYGWNMIWGRKVIVKIIDSYNAKKDPKIPNIEGIDFVLHGHTRVHEPLKYKNMIWFDTGFSQTNRVTMIEYNFKNNNFIFYQLNEEDYFNLQILGSDLAIEFE